MSILVFHGRVLFVHSRFRTRQRRGNRTAGLPKSASAPLPDAPFSSRLTSWAGANVTTLGRVGDGGETLSTGGSLHAARDLSVVANAEGNDISASGVVAVHVEGSPRAGGRAGAGAAGAAMARSGGSQKGEGEPDGSGETHIGDGSRVDVEEKEVSDCSVVSFGRDGEANVRSSRPSLLYSIVVLLQIAGRRPARRDAMLTSRGASPASLPPAAVSCNPKSNVRLTRPAGVERGSSQGELPLSAY